ncbi:peptidase M23 [Pseudomonas phage vB_Pa-PAC2]|nr:hypothetical protein RVBP16_0690 [Pseudomonas phage sp. 30-2]
MIFQKPFIELNNIPDYTHPGGFAYQRKNHIHEGVDLYCKNKEPVFTMLSGKVVNIIKDFTGPGCGTPWWNKTSALVVEDVFGVWVYGEILVGNWINIGDTVPAGTCIGRVEQVLKKNKGRPMSMLHVERYTKGTTNSIGLWQLNTSRPENLLDPTPLLRRIINE